MKEETLLILKHINSKIEEVKEKHNIDNGTCFVIPIGSYADYGYMTHEMLKDILQTQQRIEKALDFVEKQKKKMYKSRNKIALFILMKLEKILNREIGE